MKKIIVLFAIIAAAASFASGSAFQYDPHGKRDPFVPLIGAGKAAVTRLEDIVSIEDIRLEGIAIGGKGRRPS